MKKIVIVGAGGFGREVKMLIDQINKNYDEYNFLGFYDDNIPIGTIINRDKVLGSIDDLANVQDKTNVVIAIGTPDVKKRIIQKFGNIGGHIPHLYGIFRPQAFCNFPQKSGIACTQNQVKSLGRKCRCYGFADAATGTRYYRYSIIK